MKVHCCLLLLQNVDEIDCAGGGKESNSSSVARSKEMLADVPLSSSVGQLLQVFAAADRANQGAEGSHYKDIWDFARLSHLHHS